MRVMCSSYWKSEQCQLKPSLLNNKYYYNTTALSATCSHGNFQRQLCKNILMCMCVWRPQEGGFVWRFGERYFAYGYIFGKGRLLKIEKIYYYIFATTSRPKIKCLSKLVLINKCLLKFFDIITKKNIVSRKFL